MAILNSHPNYQFCFLLDVYYIILNIFKGPPGCGKTFIGVKIVQLLLSLSPRLEKPILLLTYKNHALDEFLKHMLGFCQKDDVVRIGSRSKEPELESCNLQSIMRSLSRDKSYSKATYAEIQETRDEIRVVETQIKNLSFQMDASTHLTKKSLIAEFREDQLRSLLLDNPLVYKVNRKKFDKSSLQELVNNMLQIFGTVKDFLLMHLNKSIPKEDLNAAQYAVWYNFFDRALQDWLPDRQEPQRMKAFQAEYVYRVRKETTEKVSTKDGASTSNASDGDDEDSGDEEHVRELLQTRMFSGLKKDEKSRDGLVLFTSYHITSTSKTNSEKTGSNSTSTKNKNVLIDISDYPNDMQVGPQIRSVRNIWNLDKVERLQFLYCILKEKTSSTSEEFDQLIEKLDTLKKRKEELEMDKKVEMLLQKKIIGMTITGASINHALLHQIGPSVVIVEEAAEILEPSLLAALTSCLEHLILIGDHKQLRPQVDTYELCRNFQFDKSMMERLIDSGFPYKSLTKQNRMRPEFSALLRDIYPNLQDNLELVLKNEPLKCIAKSMFFWSHNDSEKKDRTYTNVKEAERIIALVLYLLWNGCRPSDITVLAAYLGQTKLLRNMMKKAKEKYSKLFQETDGVGEREGFIQVQTIDMYQGDENQYVIISLVRSNTYGGIGFLKELNRRCVAQSRAKCGMYFVGNMDLLRTAKYSCWNATINGLIGQECAGNAMPLQCSKHEKSRCDAVDGDQLKQVIVNPKLLCLEECGEPYHCRIHRCKNPCFPRHIHGKCVETVIDIFRKCRHLVRRKCHEDISELHCKKEIRVVLEQCGHEVTKECHQRNCDILCDETVTEIFPKCGHQTEKKCYMKIEDMSCDRQCEKRNSCGIHRCVYKCGKAHAHDSCSNMIDYRFPGCNHASPRKKKCSEPITRQCTTIINVTGSCGHLIEKQCSLAENPPCTHPCEKTNSCGLHRCQNTCGKTHDHNNCQKMVDYRFPTCNHASPKKKRCSEIISWSCTASVIFKGSCGHEIMRQCYQKDGDVKCTVPCLKQRKCGHTFTYACADDCEKGDCVRCIELHKQKMKKFHDDAKKKVKDLEDKIKKSQVPIFSIDEISPTGPDSAEYQKVNDKVVYFVKPMHNWFPNVTKIEKVTNLTLEKKFEEAKSKAFGVHIDEKFHGTSDEGVKGITKDGFRMPDPNPPPNKRGMYGQGIYFATDSSKSAQQIYTKGSQKLLLCQVLLGKTKEVRQADPTLNKNRLRSERYDSVYAPRGSAVKNDEFVIFDPAQALPQYIIHFSSTNNFVPPSPKALTTQNFFKQNMKATRTVNFQDPFEMYYHFAESHFRRMAAKTNLQPATISSIDIVINKDLERKFEATKRVYKMLNIPDNEILAYHGTASANIDSILKNNLQLRFARRQAYGIGNYFSEYPQISLGYGDGLLLCRILPGKEYVDSSNRNIPLGYNSKKVLLSTQSGSAANANGEMIIIEKSDQILPFFVIHR